MAKNEQSKKWRVNKADLKRVAKNGLLFLSPVALVVLDLLNRGRGLDEILVAVKVWGLGVALDFFRKLKAE